MYTVWSGKNTQSLMQPFAVESCGLLDNATPIYLIWKLGLGLGLDLELHSFSYFHVE